MANALEKSQQYDDALKLYKKIYQNNKNNLTVITGIKKCYIGLQNYPGLVNFLEDAVKTQPKNGPLIIDLGEAYFLNGQQEKSFAIWNAHLQRNINNPATYRLVALAMTRQRLFDQAINVYINAISQIKGQETLHVDIANLYRAQLNYEKASEHLLLYYLARPKQIAYIQRQLLSISDKGQDITPVVTAINGFLDQHPDQTEIREIVAGLYMTDNRYDLAFNHYKNLETRESSGGYILKYAMESFKNSAYENAINGYEYLLQSYPASPLVGQARYDLARSYAAFAETIEPGEKSAQSMQKAVAVFEDIISSQKNSRFVINSYIELGNLYFDYYFDLDNAIFYYQQLLKRTSKGKKHDKIVIRLGDAYLTKNESKKAFKVYNLATHEAHRFAADFKIAELHYYNGDFRGAEKQLKNLQTKMKSNDPLMNDILSRQNLIKVFSEDSTSLIRFAEAELFEFQKKEARAAQAYEQLSRESNQLRSLSGRRAAKLYMHLGKFEESKSILLMLKKDLPEDNDIDEIIFFLAECEQNLNNLSDALNLYHELLTNHPGSLYQQTAREKARILSSKISEEQI
jgi:predicted Zn-dependent protease